MATWNLFKYFSPKSRSSGGDEQFVTGTKTLIPDPRVAGGLGRNHSFETAVAEIVDNSIDAGASQVLVRFITDTDKPACLYVVDNGCGMTSKEIDVAMTLGGQRGYKNTDIGHFGVGLKASSLGQAKTLIVASKQDRSKPVARRLVGERMAATYECDLLSEDFARSVLGRSWGHFEDDAGTVVFWEDIKSFPRVFHGGDLDGFISSKIENLGRHLGLMFHRLLQQGGLAITIDHEDMAVGEAGPPFPIMPVDP